jgi:hypothetical protein
VKVENRSPLYRSQAQACLLLTVQGVAVFYFSDRWPHPSVQYCTDTKTTPRNTPTTPLFSLQINVPVPA